MARYFHSHGWGTLAWNFRGCSEEINRSTKFYHSGATEDLITVLDHVEKDLHYKKLYLLGFSLGGNLILKYLGETSSTVSDNIVKAICFSVPLDLHHSCIKISMGFNRIYSARFLRMLKDKVNRKAAYYPEYFDIEKLRKVNSLIDFDDLITAPLHGFKDAVDYYRRCSSLYYLDQITIPTLIVNARNDPFLAKSCYPTQALSKHSFVEMLIPNQGGHCGFADRSLGGIYWSEVLSFNYLNSE